MELIVSFSVHKGILRACLRLMGGTKAAVDERTRRPTAAITQRKGTIMSQHSSHSSHQVQRAVSSAQVPTGAQRGNARAACDADIAKRAYEKYEARGCTHGFDREDWAAASHELIAETFGHLNLSPSRALSALPDSKQFRGA
jgi:hypothetical protein